MKVGGQQFRTIWRDADGVSVNIIDQTALPHRFEIVKLQTLEQAAQAIRTMQVRGAPLIGAAAAYGLALGLRADPSDLGLARATALLQATRPTAINLQWALDQVAATVRERPEPERVAAAYARAAAICDDDVALNLAIGMHGVELLAGLAARKQAAVNILTHCNAGWLATVDRGTATAPIYLAHERGIPIHVWVDETRPRNQGAALTAWELGQAGVSHTVIVDNTGGHLMQQGEVDLVLVGTDRVTASGDVCNKIGTYLKALAARDNAVPFYVALPSPTIDFAARDGRIPIEQRPGDASRDHHRPHGRRPDRNRPGHPSGSPVANYGFDVTPARLVTGLITERGVIAANAEALAGAFPERSSNRLAAPVRARAG